VKALAVASLAVTFWILVAIAQILVHGGVQQASERAAPRAPAARPVDPVPEPPPPPIVPTEGHPFPKVALVRGMSALRPKIAWCHEAYGEYGLAMVNVVISPTGRVSSATTTGRFAATPVGSCVEQVVRTAQFPPSDGGLRTPYPFELR
jgi:hypothetical protein